MGRTKHRPCVPQDLPEIPKASLAPAATAPLSSGKTLTTATLAQQDEMLAKQVKTQSSKRYLLPPRLSTKTAAMQDFPAEVDSEQAEVPPSPTELDCPTCELKLPSTYIQEFRQHIEVCSGIHGDDSEGSGNVSTPPVAQKSADEETSEEDHYHNDPKPYMSNEPQAYPSVMRDEWEKVKLSKITEPSAFAKFLGEDDLSYDELYRRLEVTADCLQVWQDHYVENEKYLLRNVREPAAFVDLHSRPGVPSSFVNPEKGKARRPTKVPRGDYQQHEYDMTRAKVILANQDQIEAASYGYSFNPHKVGNQDPLTQQLGKIDENASGRELRQRVRTQKAVEAGLGTTSGSEGEARRRTRSRKAAENDATSTRTQSASRVNSESRGQSPQEAAPPRRGRGRPPRKVQTASRLREVHNEGDENATDAGATDAGATDAVKTDDDGEPNSRGEIDVENDTSRPTTAVTTDEETTKRVSTRTRKRANTSDFEQPEQPAKRAKTAKTTAAANQPSGDDIEAQPQAEPVKAKRKTRTARSKSKKVRDPTQPPSAATLNMQRRWAAKKAAEAEGKVAPKIGRYKKEERPANAATNDTAADAPVLDVPAAPAVTTAESGAQVVSNKNKKRKREEEVEEAPTVSKRPRKTKASESGATDSQTATAAIDQSVLRRTISKLDRTRKTPERSDAATQDMAAQPNLRRSGRERRRTSRATSSQEARPVLAQTEDGGSDNRHQPERRILRLKTQGRATSDAITAIQQGPVVAGRVFASDADSGLEAEGGGARAGGTLSVPEAPSTKKGRKRGKPVRGPKVPVRADNGDLSEALSGGSVKEEEDGEDAPGMDEATKGRETAKKSKAAKMAQSMKRRWASREMHGVIAQKKANKLSRDSQSGPSTATAAPASASPKKTKPASSSLFTNQQRRRTIPASSKLAMRDQESSNNSTESSEDGDDEADDDESAVISPTLTRRKLSEYETFQQLSNPKRVHHGKRKSRPAALRASQSFSKFTNSDSRSGSTASSSGSESDVEPQRKNTPVPPPPSFTARLQRQKQLREQQQRRSSALANDNNRGEKDQQRRESRGQMNRMQSEAATRGTETPMSQNKGKETQVQGSASTQGLTSAVRSGTRQRRPAIKLEEAMRIEKGGEEWSEDT